jgi:peptide/nickel transport system substrate-binding protein
MKSLRKSYWIVSGFVKKYAYGIILGAILSLIVAVNVGRIIDVIPVKQSERIGRIGGYTLEEIPLDIQQKVSFGLTKIDANGEVSLDAAQTIAVSEDATQYTITLNPNLYFTDGSRLKTSDLNLSIADVDTNIVSDEVIIYSLKEPYAPFPSVLSQPILKRVNSGGLRKSTSIIGLSNYQIYKIDAKNQIITNLVLDSGSDTLEYSFFPTENDAIIAFKLGHVDKIEHLNNPALESWPNVKVSKLEHDDRYLALFFNTTDPDLQDKTIRQLLAYATPKPRDETRVISPISSSSWVYNPQVKPYEHSPEQALSILNSLKENNADLSLTFVITTTPAYSSTATDLASAWQAIGISVDIRVVPFPDVNDYQILLVGQHIPRDPDQYVLWHSTQPTNITKYQNAKIEKLLEDGRQERDKDQRKQIYQDFQRFIVEDAPVVFIQSLPTYTISRGN